MRLAIISDTHLPKGTRALPANCIELLLGADAILHAGDFATVEVLRELEALGPPVHAVHGNVDSPELQDALPALLELGFDGVTVTIIHDAGPAGGRLRRLRERFPAADVVIFGHSHQPMLERGGEGFQIFNPGSPTERRRAPSHSMGLGDITGRGIALRLVALD